MGDRPTSENPSKTTDVLTGLMDTRRQRPFRFLALAATALVLLVPVGPAFAAKHHHHRATTTAHRASTTTSTTSTTVAGLKLINYYPANYGWSGMWTHWQPATLNHDMAKAASLGANTIRVITFPYTMGWPAVSSTMESRLRQMLAMASAHGLKVQLTLYDYWGQYDHLAQSQQWTTSLLSPLRGNKTVSFVEVQNEVAPAGAGVVTWLRAQIPLIHSLLPGVPVTVSAAGGLAGMKELKLALAPTTPDFWDLHYYGLARLAYATFEQAKAVAEPSPLLIGEAGLSTVLSYTGASSQAAAEDEQKSWFSVVDAAARGAGLPPVAPWTLYDFAAHAIPSADAAPKEYGFGLYHTNGSAKPAASTVAAAFAVRVATKVATSFQATNSTFTTIKGDSNLPSMWQRWYPSGVIKVAASAGPGHVNALEFSGTGSRPGGVTSVYTTPTQPVIAHRAWTASVEARGASSTGQNFLCIAWYDGSNRWLGNSTSRMLPVGTTGWTTLSVRATPPPGAVGAAIYLDSGGNRGTVLYASPKWSVAS